MKKKIIIAMAAMLACGQGVWADDDPTPYFFGRIDASDNYPMQNGSKDNPYLISSVADLNNLAEDVNNHVITKQVKDDKGVVTATYYGYETTYFKLANNIDYSNVDLFDSDEDGTKDSNFTPIGMLGDVDNIPFRGTFDGDGHTIEGITVNQPSEMEIGLFGCITDATIKNLNLSNSKFTGNTRIGGIVGEGSGETALIENCYVDESVEVTGKPYTDDQTYPSSCIGGIIGFCTTMQVKDCRSKAIVTGDEAIGGIVGFMTGTNQSHSILTDCFYLDDNSNIVSTGTKGLVVGEIQPDETTFSYSVVATDINLTLLDNDSEATIKNATRLSNYNGLEVNVTLSGRTLYKDGSWNTLSLPFGLTVSGSTLDGATVKSLSSTALNSGTLTLTFSDNASTMTAGTPYILKWASETDITNPTFSGVKISNITANVSTDNVDFVGTYSSQVYNAVNRSVLFLGGSSKFFYPDGTAATTIGAFRAYFQLKGITAGDPTDDSEQSNSGARTFVLNFGDGDGSAGDPARIHGVEAGEDARAPQGWHTLDGRRLSGRPAAKGLYISNGRKVYVK